MRPITSATSRSRSACTTRSPPRATRESSRSARRRTCGSPVVFDDLNFSLPPLRPVARLRTVEDRQRPVRRRGGASLGRRRHHRQCGPSGRGDGNPACAGPRLRCARRPVASRQAVRLQDARTGRRDERPGRGLASARPGSPAATSRTATRRPSSTRRTRTAAALAWPPTRSTPLTPLGCGSCHSRPSERTMNEHEHDRSPGRRLLPG